MNTLKVICEEEESEQFNLQLVADVAYQMLCQKEELLIEKFKEIRDLQLRILENQSRYVKPGGLLLYSTCTLVRAENEGVVEAFLKENNEFMLEPLPLPDNFPKNESGMLALVPGQYDTDGFFIAKLRRKD